MLLLDSVKAINVSGNGKPLKTTTHIPISNFDPWYTFDRISSHWLSNLEVPRNFDLFQRQFQISSVQQKYLRNYCSPKELWTKTAEWTHDAIMTYLITDPLWGESTDHQTDSPHKGPVMRSFDVSFSVSGCSHNPVAGDMRRHDAHVTSLFAANPITQFLTNVEWMYIPQAVVLWECFLDVWPCNNKITRRPGATRPQAYIWHIATCWKWGIP